MSLQVSTLSLTVGGVSKRMAEESLTATFPANGVATMNLAFVSDDGSYVPALDAEVILTSATGVFAGSIDDVEYGGVGDEPFQPVLAQVNVSSFAALTKRCSVNTVFHSANLKTFLTQLVTDSLSVYGITLHASQVNGPTLPDLAYTWMYADAVLDDWALQTGYVWEISDAKVLRMFAPGTVAAPFNVVDGDGHAIGDVKVRVSRRSDRPYANYVVVIAGPPDALLQGLAFDSGEITAHTRWDLVVSAPTVTVQAAADALAAAILAVHLPTPNAVLFNTYTEGLRPMQSLTITVADRHVNSTFLITNVELGTDGDLLVWSVEAIEGSVYQGSPRDTYQLWQSGMSSGVVAGGGTIAIGGRSVFFFGATQNELVRDPTPTWVPASGIVHSIDSVTWGSLSATFYVQLKAASGSVTARLRNISDGTTAGTSGAIASTTLVSTSFSVSLTVGVKNYRLELLPSVSNANVNGIGFLR